MWILPLNEIGPSSMFISFRFFKYYILRFFKYYIPLFVYNDLFVTAYKRLVIRNKYVQWCTNPSTCAHNSTFFARKKHFQSVPKCLKALPVPPWPAANCRRTATATGWAASGSPPTTRSPSLSPLAGISTSRWVYWMDPTYRGKRSWGKSRGGWLFCWNEDDFFKGVCFSSIWYLSLPLKHTSDRVVKVWNLTNCKLKTNHIGHTGYLNTVTMSPDGSLCASGGKDAKAMLWDLNDGKHLYTLDHAENINALCFSPNR